MKTARAATGGLRLFRQGLHACFGKTSRRRQRASPPHLSLGTDPNYEHRCESDAYGSVRVRAWSELHPKPRLIGERYGCERAPVVKGTVVLVEVSRLPRETRKPKKLWM